MADKATIVKKGEKAPRPRAKKPRVAKPGGGIAVSGRTIGLAICWVVLFLVLAQRSDTFTSPYTASVIARQVAIFSLIALAQAVCLVVGGMNLSVGAICAISTVILGVCMTGAPVPHIAGHHGILPLIAWASVPLPAWLSIVITLGFGGVIGMINGLLITGLKIDSFIVTLSMMFVFMGLRSGISGGSPYALPDSFTFVGQQELPVPFLGKLLHLIPGIGPRWFQADSVYGIPYLFIVVVGVLALMAYVFTCTVFGRRLLATGGNLEAAKLSGINTDQMIVRANALSGLFAALAAVLWASKMGTAAPETGDDWLIVTFAVAIIGGTGLSGGVVSAPGIFMGGVIFALIKYLLVEVRVSDYWANCALGGLVLLAIILDRVREVYAARRKMAVVRQVQKPPSGEDAERAG